MTQPLSNATVEQIIEDHVATPSDALALIQSLRVTFGFVGTEFTREDVVGQFETQCEGSGTTYAVYQDSIVETVRGGYEFQNLDDILAERGNEVISEAVSELVGILDGAQGYEFTIVLTAVVDGEHVDVVERSGFGNPHDATQWGSDQMGRTVLEVIDAEEDAHPHEDAPRGAEVAQVVGMKMMASRGGIETEFTAQFEV